jgi:putative transposase
MPMIKVWLHLVWATKSRQPLLHKSIRQTVFQHMKKNAQEKNIHIDFINGYVDHVHLLISLNTDQTIAKTVQLIKGESSHWINQHNLCSEQFEWPDDYFAVSVSESGVNAVREYIKNQEEHHTKKTFQQEYDEFMKKYGFVLFPG